ncbi:MAG: hypothetical protein HFG96_00465 [Lachnospiraceae bacterium]|jgi:hypothetical protein|nr:hypothetical protein [Lachnospiraceae bacterium]
MKNRTTTNKLKQTVRAFVLAASLFSAISAGAAPLKAQVFHPTSDSSISIQATDKIVIKTRFYNGKQQYRRWNQTRACWVDPDWIDLN